MNSDKKKRSDKEIVESLFDLMYDAETAESPPSLAPPTFFDWTEI